MSLPSVFVIDDASTDRRDNRSAAADVGNVTDERGAGPNGQSATRGDQ